jgi:lipid A 3-O-deacylase
MKIIFAGAFFLLQTLSAHAVDSLSAELGQGSRHVTLWRVGAQWNQESDWLASRSWQLYWDVSVGSWHSDTGTVHDFGLTPVFRHALYPRGAYFDAGIGAHVLSESHISSDLGFSTRFQFGDHLGIGYRFEKYDLAVRFQHLSNGGMRNPNPGINFLLLRVQYHLR